MFLNGNELTNRTATKIAEVLADNNTHIKEIGLKWNKITAVGGNAIANALCENRDLKVLDLSWNSIGVRPKDARNPNNPGKPIVVMKVGDIGNAWGKAFRMNKDLVHLDLSFNKISYEETEIIQDDIQSNSTMIGLHYLGNHGFCDKIVGKVDPLGFIQMEDAAL